AAGLALGALLAFLLWQRFTPHPRPDPEKAVEDPRLTYATPFLNVHPEVQYLGDEACAECHRDKDHTYHQHSMGRSLVPVAAVAARQHYEPAAHNPFEALGRHYLVERQPGRVFHREFLKDSQGAPVAETHAEMSYAI